MVLGKNSIAIKMLIKIFQNVAFDQLNWESSTYLRSALARRVYAQNAIAVYLSMDKRFRIPQILFTRYFADQQIEMDILTEDLGLK